MKPKNKQILLGSILGNGSIYIPKNGKNPVYAEGHSIKQKDYLLWKFEELSYDLGEFNIYKNSKEGEPKFFRGQTRVNPFLKKFIDLKFEKILKKLNDFGFLVWYLDGGAFNYENNYLMLPTKAYSNQLIIKWAKEKLDIEFIAGKDKLRLSVSDTKKILNKFIDTFEKYNLPSCMKYKLGLDEEREKEAKEKKRKRQKKHYEEHRDEYTKTDKRKPEWSDEEIEVLKNNYEDMTDKEISEILDRTRKSISCKRNRLGLGKGKHF